MNDAYFEKHIDNDLVYKLWLEKTYVWYKPFDKTNWAPTEAQNDKMTHSSETGFGEGM